MQEPFTKLVKTIHYPPDAEAQCGGTHNSGEPARIMKFAGL